MRQRLKSHVFECRRGTVPQFHNVAVARYGMQRRHIGIIKIIAVCVGHNAVDLFFGKVIEIEAEDFSCQFPIGHLRQFFPEFPGKRLNFFGNEKAAVFSQSFIDGGGGADRRAAAPCADIHGKTSFLQGKPRVIDGSFLALFLFVFRGEAVKIRAVVQIKADFR